MADKAAPKTFLDGLGFSRSEKAVGILLYTIVIGGLILGKIPVSEAATMIVTITGIGAALSTGRKTTAEAADSYASAAKKSSDQNIECLKLREELQERVDALESEQEDTLAEIEKMKKRIATRDERLKTVEAQNERMKKRLDEKDEIIKSHQAQMEKLTDAVLQKDQRINELEALTSRQEKEIEKLRAELEQLKK